MRKFDNHNQIVLRCPLQKCFFFSWCFFFHVRFLVGVFFQYTWIINAGLNNAVQCETVLSNFVAQFSINLLRQSFSHVVVVLGKIRKICVSWKILVSTSGFLISGHCQWKNAMCKEKNELICKRASFNCVDQCC